MGMNILEEHAVSFFRFEAGRIEPTKFHCVINTKEWKMNFYHHKHSKLYRLNLLLQIQVRCCFLACKSCIYITSQTNKMGLEINEKNTKFMIVSQKPYSENEYVKIGTHNLEKVKYYTYLFTVLTNKNV